MSVEFEVFEGFVHSRGVGVLTTSCLESHREALVAALGSQPEREILDLTGVEQVDLTGGAVRAEVSLDRAHLEVFEQLEDPRLAIVADREVLYGLARMYQILLEGSRLTIDIFRSSEEAV
ncbi:MAG: hypothetical protein AAGA81_02805, partial [Acidobacteriota bacterium]